MLRKYLGLAFIVALCLFGLYRIRMSLRSPGERLRLRASDMVADFNRGRVSAVISGIHPDFRDASSEASKEDLLNGMRYLYLGNRESGTGRFMLEFQWLEPFEPVLDETGEVARSKIEFQIVDHHTSPPRIYWRTKADLEFLYENGGWRLVTTREVQHASRGANQ